jgi:hypothetical protein
LKNQEKDAEDLYKKDYRTYGKQVRRHQIHHMQLDKQYDERDKVFDDEKNNHIPFLDDLSKSNNTQTIALNFLSFLWSYQYKNIARILLFQSQLNLSQINPLLNLNYFIIPHFGQQNTKEMKGVAYPQ